jgi:hypothetical protein
MPRTPRTAHRERPSEAIPTLADGTQRLQPPRLRATIADGCRDLAEGGVPLMRLCSGLAQATLISFACLTSQRYHGCGAAPHGRGKHPRPFDDAVDVLPRVAGSTALAE